MSSYVIRKHLKIDDLARRWDLDPHDMRVILQDQAPNVISRDAATGLFYLLEGLSLDTCLVDLAVHRFKTKNPASPGIEQGSGLLWAKRASMHEKTKGSWWVYPKTLCGEQMTAWTQSEALKQLLGHSIEIPILQGGLRVYAPASVTRVITGKSGDSEKSFITVEIESRALVRVPAETLDSSTRYDFLLDGWAGEYVIEVSADGKIVGDEAINQAVQPRVPDETPLVPSQNLTSESL